MITKLMTCLCCLMVALMTYAQDPYDTRAVFNDMLSFQSHDENGTKHRKRGFKKSGEHRVKKSRTMSIDTLKLNQFKAFEYDIDGKIIKYRASVNMADHEAAPALVVYLHGMSGCGDDNLANMMSPGIYEIFDYLKMESINAVMVVPQCPHGFTWATRGGKQGYNKYLKNLIDNCISSMKIDRTKIYIIGVSMGGGGVWNMINDYPGFYAGAFIGSSQCRNVDLNNIAKTPIYMTFGTQETDPSGKPCDIETFSKVADKINSNGGTAKFDALDGLNHGQACEQAFAKERLDWLFSHRLTISNEESKIRN